MKLTKNQLRYSIENGEVTIHEIWNHMLSEESIRVLEYPSHIDRKRVTKITLNYDDFSWWGKQLKKIIVPSGCYLINGLPLCWTVTIEYK